MKNVTSNPSRLLAVGIALFLAACGSSPEQPDPGQTSPGEVLESSLSRDLAPQVDQQTREKLSADNRDFAFALMDQIRAEEGDANIFYSPHSISIALAMTYAGATGQTKEQMAQVLRFDLDEATLHPAFNALDLALDERSEIEVDDDGGDPPVLRVVNATWGQKGFPFSEDYLDTLAVNYGAGLRAVDFQNEADTVRQQINQWVEDQTEERIKDLLPEGSITPLTRLVLTNAIYFLAGWEFPFPEQGTSDRPFTLLDGTQIDVPLMSQTEGFAHFADEDTHAVSLPYVGRELSLIALKPADDTNFEAWEAALDREHFDAVVAGMSHRQLQVRFPSFELEGDYDVKALFEKMGWTNFGELGAMLEGGQGGLEITDILHKSFIKLDEEGTEAAAATAVVVGESDSADPVEIITVNFDRPFYYAIYDHPTDSILFLGRMMNPAD